MALSSRLFVVIMLAAVTGCGGGSGGFPKTYPVTGSVKLNGKPIDGAMVTFQLDGDKRNAIGTTDKSGEFSLSMFRPGDGAMPGQYKVSIRKEDAVAAPSNVPPPGQIGSAELAADYAPPAAVTGGGGGKKKSEIPDKYTNDGTSGLRATVVESKTDNKFDFELK